MVTVARCCAFLLVAATSTLDASSIKVFTSSPGFWAARGADGAVWQTNGVGPGGFLERVSATGSRLFVTLPFGPEDIFPGGVTLGPDGRLWVPSSDQSRIYRVATTGSYDYLVTPPTTAPAGIASGADRVWFSGGSIWEVDRDGIFTEHPLPAGELTVGSLAVAPDGAVWFAYSEAGKIGVLRPSGSFETFALPNADSRVGLTVTRTNEVWAVNWQMNSILRLSPAGTFDQFPLPTADAAPVDIVEGPDGAVWFTEYQAGKIGRITASGGLTEYAAAVPPGGKATGLAWGGDGNLWVTYGGAPAIGRLVVGGTTIGSGPCVPSALVLCLDDQPGDRRFRVEAQYESSRNGGIAGPGHALSLSSLEVRRGGLFWFFNVDNPELVVKVLDGCATNDRRWVFVSGGTDLALVITIEDVVTGEVHSYYNLDRTPFAPIQDVNALDCTP